MIRITIIIILISSFVAFSQSDEVQKIENEGKLLYRMEMASWYATDYMFANLSYKTDSLGGYLSYENENNNITTIFYNRFDSLEVIIRFEFDSIPKPEPISVVTTNSRATEKEEDLIMISIDTRNRAYSSENDFFKFYDKTGLNFIPLINENKRCVFVLTGPRESGYIIIGNDYKLEYNDENELIGKTKLHNSMIKIPYKSDIEGDAAKWSFHTHIVTEYITSTDICTLLMYKEFVEWEQHIVMNDKQVSLFDLERESLFTLTREAWERIYSNDETKDD